MLRAGGIWRDVAAESVLDVIAEIVERLPGTTAPVRQLLRQRVRTLDGISWALIGGGLGLPHLRTPVALGRDAGILAVIFLRDPLEVSEPAPDEQPITRLLFFIAPSAHAHLEFLAQLSAALLRGNLRKPVDDGASDEEIFAAIAAAEIPAKRERSE